MQNAKLNPAIAHIEAPASIRKLPIDETRGFYVPWFVAFVDGKPEFRVADGAKFRRALKERLCWVCGRSLDNRSCFPVGSMCVVNMVTAEPPCHPACAVYSVRACPFLSRPNMVRREGGMPEEAEETGLMIKRNPGVICLWTAKAPGATPFNSGNGILFQLYPPVSVSWWAEGRLATRAEVMASVDSGLPTLLAMAEEQGPGAVAALDRMRAEAQPLFDQALPC